MKKSVFQRFFCILLVSLLINLSIAPAFAEGMPAGNLDVNARFDDPDVLGPGMPELIDTPVVKEFRCSTPESDPERNVLKPEEVAKLKQETEIENKGFSIDNINSGRGENNERDLLENNIIVQKNDQGDALVNEMPGGKMDIGEISQWFNKYYSGPFAFGVSLDDTLRIGQCRDIEGLDASGRGCPLQDKQLSYRNSGRGVIANFSNVWEDVKDLFDGKEQGQYNDEQLEKVQLNIASETDVNSLQAKYFERPVEQIPNSVITEDFTASMATTGDDSKSLISIYSAFDKYFNSWFSTEMVVTTFGPTLVGQAKKYAGWAYRRGWPWNVNESSFMQGFRKKFMYPESVLGQARMQRMVTRTDKYGFGDFWTKGIEAGEWDSGYAFVKGSSWRKYVNDISKPGSYLDEMTDPVRRGEFFKLVKDLRGYAYTNKAVWSQADEAYSATIKAYGKTSPEARAALIDYARTNAKLMTASDQPWLRLDALELWTKDPWSGLYNVAVKPQGIDQIIPLTGDSKHIGVITNSFSKGDWGFGPAAATFPYETTSEGFMKFYKVSPYSEFLDDVPVDDLRKNLSRYVDKAVQTEKGDFIPVTDSTINYIASEAAGTGKVKVYRTTWAQMEPETPELFAKRLTHGRAQRINKTMPTNMDRLYDTLVEKNFAGQSRRYYNVLDKAFAQEQEILKSYFSVKGGLKWTLMPYLYWEGKRGFGFEGISAFQLPDSWKEVELYTDEEEIFDDAFIDILVQHGSDEGEIFVQVLDKLPWKMALNYLSEKFSPVNEAYEKMTTPLSGWRREVENVAYFTSTREECATCGVVLMPRVLSQSAVQELQEKGRGEAVISFNVEQDMKSYFVEDILDEDVKKEGTTLVAFGHHTNITGEQIEKSGQEAEDIDLIQAKKDKTRCSDAVKDLGLGFLGDNPSVAGGILAFGESMGYFMFFWSGIIGSVIQQTLIVPKLQDCVDDTEGYYLHMFAAYDKEKEDVESPNEKGSKAAGDIVQNFNEFVLGKQTTPVVDDDDKPPVDASGQPYTPDTRDESNDDDRVVFNRASEEAESLNIWERAKQEITKQSETLSQKAQSSNILQMEVATVGGTKGIAFFQKMFFFWFKGNTQQAVYDDISKSVLEDNDKNVSIIVNKESGEILVKQEGKPAEAVITSEDHVRMSGPDGRVPAEVIPQRIGRVELPGGTGVPMFEMDYQGGFKVLDETVLDCIKRNVEEQTGIPLSTNNISDAFGRVNAIVTDSYPTITGSAEDKTITANGSPREIVYGDNARVLVMSDLNTSLLNGRQVPVGNFRSVQFKNGVILYKPGPGGGTGELLIWLRYNEISVVRRSDVSDLKATLADALINSETGCPEPAIDLEAIPNTEAGEDSATIQRVDNFNIAIKKMGPFQIFDTDRHRFVFYSEKTSPGCNPSQEGCCQERVSVIDKQTGEVYDQAIVGGVKQTPTGIKFTTADGQNHTLDFSADNGIPKISYNDLVPETLTMARGPNGAFWYDPEDELWRPYNAQLLPLLEAFKTQGFDTRHREDCSSSTIPGNNTMNVQFGGASDTPFNLPSMPLQPAALLLFVVSLLAVICVARLKIEKRLSR